ncbi:MAG: pyrimidine dimer DNA glycosylase/endonuclease V [Nocardioides sp.]|uniref:pyrimidine dimer DNA glycosylase/endonuclease V n=1 Tax=Nocardioides sp. TaxID=35761 RepID=UPI0039E5E9DE
MRLWSLHPRHLDRAGLTACWREALLAQAVLLGRTRGYTRHPQLERFRGRPDPAASVGEYLSHVAAEAGRRGYRFNAGLIERRDPDPIEVTDGQLGLEWTHLLNKLAGRSPELWRSARLTEPTPHPMMRLVSGPPADWERARPPEAGPAGD